MTLVNETLLLTSSSEMLPQTSTCDAATIIVIALLTAKLICNRTDAGSKPTCYIMQIAGRLLNADHPRSRTVIQIIMQKLEKLYLP